MPSPKRHLVGPCALTSPQSRSPPEAPVTAQTPNETYVHRIQALLDKAESTTFPEEAEALLAKAQQLMARHAVDEAMLASRTGDASQIATEHIVVHAPYASAKVTLLGAVAHANRCRVVSTKGPNGRRHCSVVGHADDLADVRLLFTVLSFQAVRFMLDATVPPGDTPRRFRHSFVIAYAARIGERLREAERAAIDEAQRDQLAEAEGRSVSLVLASRTAKVDAAFHQAFPHTRRATVSSSSGAGHRSGRSAADRAALGQAELRGTARGLPG